MKGISRIIKNICKERFSPHTFKVPILVGFEMIDRVGILTWHGRHPDQQGGSPRARPVHCTPGGLTPAIASNAGDSSA